MHTNHIADMFKDSYISLSSLTVFHCPARPSCHDLNPFASSGIEQSYLLHFHSLHLHDSSSRSECWIVKGIFIRMLLYSMNWLPGKTFVSRTLLPPPRFTFSTSNTVSPSTKDMYEPKLLPITVFQTVFHTGISKNISSVKDSSFSLLASMSSSVLLLYSLARLSKVSPSTT